nr:putative trna pseudouridine synthase 4 [Quercus suber]
MGGSQTLFRSLMHHKVTDFANIYVNTMKSSSEPRSSIIEGCFAIHKPPGITSAQVIRDVQRHFDPSKLFKPMLDAELARRDAQRSSDPKQKKRTRRERRPLSVKMGHGGTLDPMATGVLVLGVGIGTKSLPKFLECTKSYETVLLMGTATDTYDTSGKIVARKPYEHVTRETVEKALDNFRGKIMQKPPLWSALRVQGKRLYEYAREGKEVPVEIKERPVEVLELELMEWMDGGSHEWQWPTTEAPQEEKEFAEKVLDGEETAKSIERVESAQDEVVDGSAGKSSSPEARPLSGLSETTTNGALSGESPAYINAQQPNGVQAKRKREDVESGGGNAIDPANPPLKRAKSPSFSTSRTSSAPSANADGLIEGEGTATLVVDPPPSNTSSSPCPAPAMRIRMTVTSGFYVRSLCQDLGVAVGSVSTMASLVRSRQAEFSMGTNVLSYEDLAKGEDVWGPQVQQMLEDWQEKEKVAKLNTSNVGTTSTDSVEESVEGSGSVRGEKLRDRRKAFTRRNTSSAEED